jgi:hypothetical protein
MRLVHTTEMFGGGCCCWRRLLATAESRYTLGNKSRSLLKDMSRKEKEALDGFSAQYFSSPRTTWRRPRVEQLSL